MITTLMIVVLALTALLALSLPWAGWGSGMDAAGKGMAMFFPVIFMGARFICFVIAIIALASGGGLAWTGLPAFAAGALAVALVGGMGASSFIAVERLTNAPRSEGRPQLAFLAAVAAPLALVLWIFVERYGATDPAQVWPVRALVLVLALAPPPLIGRINRKAAADRQAAIAEEAREEAEADARVAALPSGATALDILQFHDALAENDWRARGKAMARLNALPDLKAQFMAMLKGGDRETKITAGFHVTLTSLEYEPGYFEAIRPILADIIQRLEDSSLASQPLRREAHAAIRLAWPAMHTTNLPRAQMLAFYEAVVKRGESDEGFRPLQHDVKLLADLVNG